MNHLKELSKSASQCVKCGTCLAHCPIYTETLSELTTARGKLSLIESLASGEIQFTRKLEDLFFSCLICNSCEENCPNDVKVGDILLKARRELIDHRGLPMTQKFLFRHLLNSIHALPLCLHAGCLIQGLLLKRIPKESGLQLRFSLPFLDKRRLIPPIAKKFFCNSYSPMAKANSEKKRVGYFVGCAVNYLFPHIGEATLRILNPYGISVLIPSDQKCCGLIAFGSGDWQSAQKLALSNMEAFEQINVDTIITTCASCAAMLTTFYSQLFKDADDAIQRTVERFSHKIMDISQFLTQKIGIATKPKKHPFKKGDRLRITYHDPCHLNRTLGIKQEPRDILQSLSNLEFIEMNDASRCCGMGGSFNIAHYDLSMNILKHKLDTLETLGVDMIATGCSGCIFQFMDGIHQRGLTTKVVHIVEALEMDREIG